jgi:hypothetical protein
LDRGSARRKATTYKGQHKHLINADIYALSVIRTHDPSVERAKTFRAIDRPASVIGYAFLYNEYFFQTWIQMEDLNAPPSKYG